MTSKQFQERRVTLINYLRSKVNGGDWHAVSDAANDLRALEAKWGVTRELAPFKQAYEMLKPKNVFQAAMDMLATQPTSTMAETVARLQEKEAASRKALEDQLVERWPSPKKPDHVLNDITWKPAGKKLTADQYISQLEGQLEIFKARLENQAKTIEGFRRTQ